MHENYSLTSLFPSHAYTVTGFFELTQLDGQRVQLVRLRNPWGNDKEWKGNWGDKDEKWKSISEEEKEKFKVVKSSDGEFYMAFDDYVELFVVLVVVHIRPDSMLSSDLRHPGGHSGGKMEVFHFNGSWKGETAGGCGNDGWGEFH